MVAPDLSAVNLASRESGVFRAVSSRRGCDDRKKSATLKITGSRKNEVWICVRGLRREPGTTPRRGHDEPDCIGYDLWFIELNVVPTLPCDDQLVVM